MPDIITGEEFVSDFLEHHGVKGMKWGVIRSKAQLVSDRISAKKEARKDMEWKTDKGQRKDREKALADRRFLSDKGMQVRIARYQQEKLFKDLTERDLHPGKTAAKTILTDAAKTTARSALPKLMAYGGKQFVANALKNPEMAEAVFGQNASKKTKNKVSNGEKILSDLLTLKTTVIPQMSDAGPSESI